ncbi:hypothetical protein ACFZAM_04635 [Streptomyces sp. NPDC008079]|uniref:hypothetical protein n=1 Tax=Streptomyces sp. NPDC008079 TaxID=3364806 RepID=UPI0036EAD9FC
MEIAIGYVCAWLVAKARRVAGRADAEVDRGLDAGMDRLHTLVSGALGEDPALERAAREADAGEVSARTRRRLTDALDEAVEQDGELAEALRRVVDEVRALTPATASAEGDGVAIGGNVEIRADGGSAAAVRMGDVTIGNPLAPDPQVPGPPQA